MTREKIRRGRRGRRGRRWLLLALSFIVPTLLSAQDPVDQGVRLGITYTPGMRPGMLVLGGPDRELLDSVRTIIQRDLGYSDRFEMIYLPGGDSLVLGVSRAGESGASDLGEIFVNYSLYAALGADYAVSVLEEPDSSLSMNLYDVGGEAVRASVRIYHTDPRSPEFRMAVHRASD
ncbi:MAG: hypothetical protein JSW51_09810, partial [Gemmatimonadota bacterium]